MKLIKTIRNIVKEAEENYYLASQKSTSPKELEILEKKLDDSLRLLELYEDIENEKED